MIIGNNMIQYYIKDNSKKIMKRKKTIAIAINTSWNIYNFRVGLLKALQEEGYNIVVVAPHDVYSEKLEALGFAYHNIDINNKGTNPL